MTEEALNGRTSLMNERVADVEQFGLLSDEDEE